MKTLAAILAAFVALATNSYRASADTFGSGDNTFEIEFVTIGDPGNPPDTTGDPNPAGAVDYIYDIGKFEISRDMIEKANAESDLAITLHDMTDLGGNGPNRPATGVSWNEAARFTNWLNTSQGFPAAYNFSAQPGDPGYDANANIELWEVGAPGFQAANRFRNSQAKYFLPGVHEWYKAAYYDPNANGGGGGYWDYPTGSDAAPTPVASGTDSGTAVSLQMREQGHADVTQAGGLSPYGVMGLGGNVIEWEETKNNLINDNGASDRGLRGGDYGPCCPGSVMDASFRFRNPPSVEFDDTVFTSPNGFRVASCPANDCVGIPEPSSLLLGVLGAIGLLLRRWSVR